MAQSRIRITAQELVAKEIGQTQVSPTAVEEALARVRRRGFIPSFIPKPEAYRQHMIFVHERHPLAPVHRALDGEPTPVRSRLIEEIIKFPISQTRAGMTLARYGLAILRATQGCVILRGTSTEMAYDANASRYRDVVTSPCWLLVERVLGLLLPPAEIDEDIRLRTAQAYDLHEVGVDGLLEGANNCTLVSPWQFPVSECVGKKD